jgi:hypothetical protein
MKKIGITIMTQIFVLLFFEHYNYNIAVIKPLPTYYDKNPKY